ncbi:MAG TPA: aspartate aminotransferase family protein [Candidatus Acidoferrales bacterium]|nr:aspartate aminotransferase family protein [Candidatus Acidoferrales bacterium]
MGEAEAARSLFPRNFHKPYPFAARGEGCWLFTSEGKKLLDAAGSGAVVSIGHGVEEIGRAMAQQARQLGFVHSTQFHNQAAEELAERLLALAPARFRSGGRVFLTSGGSEATETALKLCRQYWLERGEPRRTKVVSRWQSYHGTTLGALAVSGNVGRRKPYLPLLADWGHIPPCYCYRCPLELSFPQCDLACAAELENRIAGDERGTVAGFIFEPVVGATLGGVAPAPGYLERIDGICRRHDVLLIADEVITGIGRLGTNFGVDRWGIEPDLITVGKGVGSGYAPLGAVLASGRVVEAIARGSGKFVHGFTYNAHPVSAAAGVAVLNYLERLRLIDRVLNAGAELARALEGLKARFPIIGDVRGSGLLFGIELVRDRDTRAPFPPDLRMADRVYQAAFEAGVLTYPVQGCVDGERGDHLMLAPPFVISEAEIEALIAGLETAFVSVQRS